MVKARNLLLSIINNVLDMARIESGKLELDENYFPAGTILKEVYEVFDSKAKSKNIDFTYEMNVNHEYILCDKTKVQEILINLVSNAIKFTPEGGKVILKTLKFHVIKKDFLK